MNGEARITFDEAWVVWSHEHDGWWMPNECGYTNHFHRAGVYTQERALQIEHNADKGNETAYSLRDQLERHAQQQNVATQLMNAIVGRPIVR